jgi:hypothetical protein
VHPWPIRWLPAATTPAVRTGAPVGALRCGHAPARFRVHVEVFIRRAVAIVPAGIGHGPGCVYPLRTSTPTGVVEVAARGATLDDLLRVWGQTRFRTARVYVGGRRAGAARTLRLTPHAEVVLEVGGYVPPHPSYLFPPSH